MSSLKGNLDINDDRALEAGQCLDEFIRNINSHITGACMIPIKLPKKEVIQIVSRAKEWFYKKYEDSVQENYYVVDKANFNTAAFKSSRKIELPGPRPDGSGRIFSVTSLNVAGEQMIGLSGKRGFVRDNAGGEPIAKVPRLSDFVTSHKVPAAKMAPKAKDGTPDDDSGE